MVIYMAAYVDRYLLSLLIEPIKADLALSDFQIGLLIGPAFVMFFVTLGLPLGWLADRTNRTRLLAASIALWSLMTAACGFAKGFATLFVARMGVGVGEAAAAPCSVSLLSDYFAPGMRPRAVALWMAGAPVGAGATYLVGGQVIEWVNALPPLSLPSAGPLRPWQVAFVIVGLPGLLLALAMALTVREPLRQQQADAATLGDGVRVAVDYLRSRASSYASVFLGIVGVTAIGGSSFWAPALFERTWGWGVGKTGLAIGIVLLVTGLTGTTFGGWLAARWVRRGLHHGPYLTVLLGCCVIFPAFALFPLMPSAEIAVALLFVGFLGMSITSGTSPSAVVGITPSQLRGQMTALFFFTINLLGGLTGPPLVGLVADALGGGDNLKYGMAITCAGFGIMMCSVLVWGLPHYRRSAAAFAAGTDR